MENKDIIIKWFNKLEYMLSDTMPDKEDEPLVFKTQTDELNEVRDVLQFLKEKNKLTRLEVIDNKGRSYVNWNDNNKIKLSYQDSNKTLKIFITKSI